MNGHAFSQWKSSTCDDDISKIFSPEPCTEPISTKLCTKHPSVNGIQVCSNKGTNPFPRGLGDNNEIAKIH